LLAFFSSLSRGPASRETPPPAPELRLGQKRPETANPSLKPN
jgi:hypothetical protein